MEAQTNDQSMRAFIAMAERRYPDEVVRVREKVSLELDITSTVFEFEGAGRNPILIFENVEGSKIPVVTNLAGNRRLLAACLDVEPRGMPDAFRQRCQNYLPVEVVNRAPWQDIVWEGDQVDLTKLPIPKHFAVDAAPYITA